MICPALLYNQTQIKMRVWPKKKSFIISCVSKNRIIMHSWAQLVGNETGTVN